jgi:hypothetical protein
LVFGVVVVGVAGIIPTKEGGAIFDDFTDLFACYPIAPKKLCNVPAE